VPNQVTTAAAPRLAYIDWMRGLACLLMFEAHAYDSWLQPAAKQTDFYMYAQLLGGLPAPLFLFLAGISFVLVTDKLQRKGATANQIAARTIRRGAEIWGLGLLFHLQEYLLNWRWSPWTDVWLVDILNVIGVAMMLMGVLCRLTASARHYRWQTGVVSALAMLATAMLTPPLWTTWRLRWLPWPLESYVCGVHTFNEPQAHLFPVFPWAAFAFAGLAVGFLLLHDGAKRHQAVTFAGIAVAGALMIGLARWLDHSPRQLYAVYDFWHTSPNYVLIRVGVMMLIMAASYAWCRRGWGQWKFSPLIQLGQTSLLVYWVHIEFVYGRLILLPSHANAIPRATAGLVFVTTMMLVLSLIRTEMKSAGKRVSVAAEPSLAQAQMPHSSTPLT
jgi:uncharacterized membrane protein